MTTKPLIRLIPAMLLLLVLGACSNKSSAPLSAPADANKTPADAVTSVATLMKAGNIDGILKVSLPDSDYHAIRKKYASNEFKTKPVSAADRAKFAAQMDKMTAPDAEAKLFNDAKPMLAQFNSKYRTLIPMYVGMGQTMAANAIDKLETMSPEEKTQAKAVMAQMAQWVQTTDWGDQAKAKQAISVVVDTARKLDIKTLDQARALTYDQAMTKYAQVWGAAKQVFGIYGFDIDKTLGSVQATTLSSDANKATVAYTYTLFGQAIKGQASMIKLDGHWYNLKFLESVAKGLGSTNALGFAAPYTPEVLGILIDSGNYPAEKPSTTKVESLEFTKCVLKYGAVMRELGKAHPVTELAATTSFWGKKAWRTDGTETITCNKKEQEARVSHATYQ